MSITCTEKWIGRSADGTKAEVDWLIFGTDDDDAARSALLATAPASKDGLPRIDDQCSVRQTNTNDFEGRVVYATPGLTFATRETGESTYQFDTTGGGTTHIDLSRETMAAYGVNANVNDYGRLIGVDQEAGKPKGANVPLRDYAWSETHYLANHVVDNAYKQTLFNLTTTVNNATFKGFLAGTTLFVGARGGQRGREDWEITFLFHSKPTVTLEAFEDVPEFTAEGWWEIWHDYERFVLNEGTSSARWGVRRVRSYCERVLDYSDFAGIGIGT